MDGCENRQMNHGCEFGGGAVESATSLRKTAVAAGGEPNAGEKPANSAFSAVIRLSSHISHIFHKYPQYLILQALDGIGKPEGAPLPG
jgi:hypothetical protein